MKIGATLPQFRDDADHCVEAARHAEEVGLDGVFVFDHMWPIGNPEGIVLHSHALMGALAEETARVQLGVLVARVGLMPDAVLANTLATQARIAGIERTVAGIGAGDRLTRAENEEFGVEYPSVAERLASVARVCDMLRAEGVTTWTGGRSPLLRAVTAEHADGLNIWGASPAELVSEVADMRDRAGRDDYPVSWGGQVLIGHTDADAAAKLERYGPRPHLVHGTVREAVRHFEAMAEGGVTYAICAPLDVHDDYTTYETLAEVQQALPS